MGVALANYFRYVSQKEVHNLFNHWTILEKLHIWHDPQILDQIETPMTVVTVSQKVNKSSSRSFETPKNVAVLLG